MKNKRSMVISLIGRPNVGKSSIFNRLMKKQYKAITYDTPGVTRDRHYDITSFDDLDMDNPKDCILVDTGGFYPQEIDETGKNEKETNFNKFFNIMTDHAHVAIDESDIVLFVCDIREGALPFDKSIVDYIRAQKKKFWVVINKYDSDKQIGDEIDFYSLGIDSDDMYLVSAAHGIGIGQLREDIHQEAINFEKSQASSSPELQMGVTPREEVAAKIALIGAPNAGKSTLLNQLVGSNRALVSDIPGTTVDPIGAYFDLFFGNDAHDLQEEKELYKNDGVLYEQYQDFRKNNTDVFEQLNTQYDLEEEFDKKSSDDSVIDDSMFEEIALGQEKDFEKNLVMASEQEIEEVDKASVELQSLWRSIHIVDTAGIRKQKKIDDFIESQSVFRSLKSITESDIVIYMCDATKGISHQDRRLIDIAFEKGKSVIVCLNKIDLLGETFTDQKLREEWLEKIRFKIPWLSFCDLIPISAKENKRIKQLKHIVKKTILIRHTKVPTGSLNRFVLELVDRHPVVVKGSRGKTFRIKYASQLKSNPPTFLFFTNKSKGIPENYKRYLKNGLRTAFNFDNTPIHLIFRTGTDLAKRLKLSKKAYVEFQHS